MFGDAGAGDLTASAAPVLAASVTQGSAASLPWATGSLAHVCMDPPYYDNVMYAELADFFYVWEKRTLGRARARVLRRTTLTDKDNEAVANPATVRGDGSPEEGTRRPRLRGEDDRHLR